jgi:hypothetical protein
MQSAYENVLNNTGNNEQSRIWLCAGFDIAEWHYVDYNFAPRTDSEITILTKHRSRMMQINFI